ncbi:MAG TPA: malto-oligosyltrehalose trehalohydrolase [Methylomirabilota bacterium]
MSRQPAVRRGHRMPFGAETRDDGTTRFRLWAPAARSVELWLADRQQGFAMPRDASGWAEWVTRDAPPGARYSFRIDGELLVPDPASRYQPHDVHGPSEVVDPLEYAWSDSEWHGIAPERLVYYELHVGTFSPEGSFAGLAERLDHLVALGVTAVELMPVADFPGRWGWGYDGVLPFAPDASYGRPEELKALVEACHARGLAVFLDVVYNHLGPEGNYLHRYAPAFFSRERKTPWGDAINLDEPGSEVARSFVVHNALYWLEEFHLDGLRLDAVHAMPDSSSDHVLTELARAVADGPGRDRLVHLVLENDANEARLLTRSGPDKRPLYLAQWNDDVHHALHVMLTGERGGYYEDYQPPLSHLARSLTEGFAYQGQWSSYRGRARGEPSAELPPTSFVDFLQNHDQIGNRALGERITALAPPEAVRAGTAVLLLAPPLPLLFMGEEWAAPEPFLFFSDLGPDLSALVSEGRRREFERFPEFSQPESRERIPDPQAETTRTRSVLDWRRVGQAPHAEWLAFHRQLLEVRAKEIAPLLRGEPVPEARATLLGATALEVEWVFPERRVLRLIANLGSQGMVHKGPAPDWGRQIYPRDSASATWNELAPWTVRWYLSEVTR